MMQSWICSLFSVSTFDVRECGSDCWPDGDATLNVAVPRHSSGGVGHGV